MLEAELGEQPLKAAIDQRVERQGAGAPERDVRQQHHRFDQSNHEPGARLADVQANHVLLQTQPSLDNVARRRQKMVR